MWIVDDGVDDDFGCAFVFYSLLPVVLLQIDFYSHSFAEWRYLHKEYD